MRGSGTLATVSDQLITRLLAGEGPDDRQLAAEARDLLRQYYLMQKSDDPVALDAGARFEQMRLDHHYANDLLVFGRRDGRRWFRTNFLHIREPGTMNRTLCGKVCYGRSWKYKVLRGYWKLVVDSDGELHQDRGSFKSCSNCQRLAKGLTLPSLTETYPWTPLRIDETERADNALAAQMRSLGISGKMAAEIDGEKMQALGEALSATIRVIAAERAYEERWWEKNIRWKELLDDESWVPSAPPDRERFVEILSREESYEPLIKATIIHDCYPEAAERIHAVAEAKERWHWSYGEAQIVGYLEEFRRGR